MVLTLAKVERMTKPVREQMPKTAEWVDSLRRLHGLLPVDRQIRRAMKGEPVFYAKENGHEVGTKAQAGTMAVRWNERGVSYVTPIVEPPTVFQFTLPGALPKGKF